MHRGALPVQPQVAHEVGRDELVGAAAKHVSALARELRAGGVRADVHYDAEKVGKQFKAADERGIPIVALVGPDEVSKGSVAMKVLASGERAEVPRAEAAAWIAAHRSA